MEEQKRIIAGKDFLILLKHLRTVIIQDSVFLVDTHEDHGIWLHEIFRSEEYLAYAEDLKAAVAACPPSSQYFEVQIPVIADAMTALGNNLSTKIDTHIQATNKMQETVDKLKKSLEDAAEERRIATEHRARQDEQMLALHTALARLNLQREQAPCTAMDEDYLQILGRMSSIFQSPAGQRLANCSSGTAGPAFPATPQRGPPPQDDPPPVIDALVMDRKVNTIAHVWGT
ncbi:hypothetical protein DFS34DRAFT_590457 [Phlyctochytrium arcticum]|nr:hypothetical protein DFS34DRAFT_598303 [Phlyctochytrium arcticum]KAI9104036.1 hypothetical protein DFS34DRAFT_590457 [Phlyctochytrium arcticum]